MGQWDSGTVPPAARKTATRAGSSPNAVLNRAHSPAKTNTGWFANRPHMIHITLVAFSVNTFTRLTTANACALDHSFIRFPHSLTLSPSPIIANPSLA
jgi:hypothetical protein